MMRFSITMFAVVSALGAEAEVPRVVDGDTLSFAFAGVKVRLDGFDAPEKAQICDDKHGRAYKCGKVAADALKALISGRDVICSTQRKKDRYGRELGACSVGGVDIGAYMVSNGHAEAYRKYSLEYVILEEQAHAAGLGIWQGRHTAPSDWRKGVRP